VRPRHPEGRLRSSEAARADRLRQRIAAAAPFLRERVIELKDWDDIKLLTVTVDRLTQWYRPGLLSIGDAAHAMSPIGGVGINLAIQDAVAAANILAAPLREGRVSEDQLRAVQRRREFPTRATQRVQLLVQNRIIANALGSTIPLRVPWLLRLLLSWPPIRRIPARILGLGIRPEHVKTPAA
jgi:2-polyprenyl-6-methoxyphenol hydroxylase-like FAD-dependent oxidoreductase